jgi:hypothetical protein
MATQDHAIVGVVFEISDWKKIAEITEKECKARGPEWSTWANSIIQVITSQTQSAASPDDSIKLHLSKANWRALGKIMVASSQGQHSEWISRISMIMDYAANDAKGDMPVLTKSRSENYFQTQYVKLELAISLSNLILSKKIKIEDLSIDALQCAEWCSKWLKPHWELAIIKQSVDWAGVPNIDLYQVLENGTRGQRFFQGKFLKFCDLNGDLFKHIQKQDKSGIIGAVTMYCLENYGSKYIQVDGNDKKTAEKTRINDSWIEYLLDHKEFTRLIHPQKAYALVMAPDDPRENFQQGIKQLTDTNAEFCEMMKFIQDFGLDFVVYAQEASSENQSMIFIEWLKNQLGYYPFDLGKFAEMNINLGWLQGRRIFTPPFVYLTIAGTIYSVAVYFDIGST